MLSLLKLLERSRLFVALCAALLVAKVYLIAGLPVFYPMLFLIFFSSLLVYNLAVLRVHFRFSGRNSLFHLKIEGDTLNLFLAAVSLPLLLIFMPYSSPAQVLVYLLIAVFSLIYMMPFTWNDKSLSGIRKHWLMKNVLLSLIWTSATVLFPLMDHDIEWSWQQLTPMILRNFFFIYALTVIYDIRDLEADRKQGIETLVMSAGIKGTQMISAVSLTGFLFFVWIDPIVTAALKWILTASALFALAAVIRVNPTRSRAYYAFMVDGAIAVQSIMVILFFSFRPPSFIWMGMFVYFAPLYIR